MEELKKTIASATKFYNNSPTLAESFPLTFKKNTVDSYNCFCVNCNKSIEQTFIKGYAIQTTPTVFSITAVANCTTCKLLNIHDYVRIREDDGVLSKQFYLEGSGWMRQIYHQKKKGLLERLFKL